MPIGEANSRVVGADQKSQLKTNRHADSQGTSSVLHRDELKSQLCGLSAEAKLRTSQSFFVAVVKDGFVVGFFGAEQVIHNPSELVSRGGDGLGFAELPGDTPKELAEIVFGVMQRVRGHAQRSGNAAPDAATLGIEHLATTDLILRTKSQPGCKGGGIAKSRHLCANLAQDGLGCNRADARHVGEIDSEDPVQFTAEVERLRLIAASLICGCLGSFR